MYCVWVEEEIVGKEEEQYFHPMNPEIVYDSSQVWKDLTCVPSYIVNKPLRLM